MYDPYTARFMQEDTYNGDAASILSLNIYVYCANNPVKYIDPSGHAPQSAGEYFAEREVNLPNVFDYIMQLLTGIDWKAINAAISGMGDMVNQYFGDQIGAFMDRFQRYMQQEMSARDVLIVSGAMVIAGLILMPVHPHIGSGLINAGMTTGMMGINALFNPGVKITQGEFLKAGFAGFVSGLVGSGIQSGFLKIGKTGIMGPIASAAGDMATDAAFQYMMTGKVDGKQVIVSGMTSLVCSEYMRQVATDMHTTAGLKAYANSQAGKTAQRSVKAVAGAADGHADDAARAVRNSLDSTPGVAGVDEVGISKKTYQTYTKTNPTTGEIYSGRTSGMGTPAENLRIRDAHHHMNEKGFGPAVLDESSSNYAAIRGREQMLIDANGGAKSIGGTSGNAINGISPNNPKIMYYLEEAYKEFIK